VFWRRPNDYAARLLFLLTACVLASEGISQAVVHSNVIGPSELLDPLAFWSAQFFNSLIWPFLIAPVYINLFWRFPVTKRPLREHHRLTLALLYGFVPVLTGLAWLFTHEQPLLFWSVWSTLSGLTFVFTLALAIVSVAHSWWSARHSAERAQIRWVTFGTIVTSLSTLAGGAMATLGVLGLYPLLDMLLWRLPMLALPICLAVAILRYHLFEIDIIVRRTLIYGMLTALLLVIYFALVIVLEPFFPAATGQPQSELVTVLSTLGVAALFAPLRRGVQAFIDRRFYRRRYDAAFVLSNFGATVRDEVELNKLSEDLLTVVQEAVQPMHVSLWLKPIEKSARIDGRADEATRGR
jgi:hypothetical protein